MANDSKWKFRTTKKKHFLDVDRNTQNKMIAVGENGLVCISSNDGDSWQETHSFTNKDLRGITFRDDQNSFIVGEQGSLFHVTE